MIFEIVYDTESRRWSVIAPSPRARANARAIVVGDKILFAGGGTPSQDGKNNGDPMN